MSKKVFLDSFYPIQQAFKKLDVSGLNEEEKKAHEKLRVRVLKMSRTVNKRNRKDEYCQMRDKANNVNRAQLETRMGDAALERLDVDTALSHFQTALTIMDKHPYFDKDDTNTLRERYQTIREQWRIKDVLHGNIRKQVCQQLPESELREAVRSIAKIKKNLKHLVKQDDVWTLKKLHREIEERIDEVNDAIMISKETKDVAEAKEYKEWMEQLDKSYEEIGKLINKMGDGDADEEPDDEEPDDEEPDDAEPDDAEPDDEEPDDEEPDDEDA